MRIQDFTRHTDKNISNIHVKWTQTENSRLQYTFDKDIETVRFNTKETKGPFLQ